MAARTPKAPNKQQPRPGGGASGSGRKPTPTRAQIKAMEARAASTARATAIARGADADDVVVTNRSTTAPASSRFRTREGIRTTDRGVSAATAAEFSVRTEMEYQRRDLYRLLIVAAIILVVFIALTFVLR